MTTAVTERLASRVLARPEHRLSRKDISADALKVLYRLHRSGYLAYLVGGGVRDLLLGLEPKDFDIATNARPQEIRRLFRNSRIIGRRFRLVHVFFKNEIVEVSTFRASPEPPEGPDDWEEAEHEAMEEAAEEAAAPVVDPNGSYGTPCEDARRRDFTVNALFYNVADFSIIDYVGGLDDLEARVIRTIGEPETRYSEDPVRMMRALEYGVRLDFRLDPASRAGIDSCCEFIREASPARLTYELMEGLRSGAAAGICDAWCDAGLFQAAFPELEHRGAATRKVLERLDAEVARGGSFPDASLIGALFLSRLYDLVGTMTDDSDRLDNAEMLARLRVMLAPPGAAMHLSNHTLHLLHQGLFTLTKLRRPPERGRQVLKLVRQDYFPVAWDLFGFAASTGLTSREVHREWARAVQRVREGRIDDVVPATRKRRSGRRRRRGGKGR